MTKKTEATKAQQLTETQSIHSRAMLVSLRLSTWTARKYDKAITKKVNSEHGAVSDAGRYNKMLIPGDALSYKALMQLASQIRIEHYTNTLAWSDEGWRLLPTANYMAYTDFTRKRKAEFMSHLDSFIAEYPDLREAAKVRLNGMYRDDDYPATSQIRGKFGFYLDFAPLPAQGDFRVDLPAEEIRRIEADCLAKVTSATDEAMNDLWKRLHDCVTHIHERLSSPDAIFRDSLITNAAELCEIIPRLNVTGNQDLEALRHDLGEYIACQDPDAIREDDSLRESVADLAEDIVSRMSAFYTPEEAS